METDLERYAWLVAYELREARASASPEERRDHERLARTYTMKMYALENDAPAIPLGPRVSKTEPPSGPDAGIEDQEASPRPKSDTERT